MAKKKKAKTDKDVAQLQKDIEAGKKIDASLLGPGGYLTTGNGFLGRVDENVDREALNRSRELALGAGVNSADQQFALDNLKRLAETAGLRSSDIQELIDRRRANLDTAGQLSPEMTGLADEAAKRYAASQTVSPDLQNALDRARAGLGGFTSPEAQAFIENQTADTNRALAGALSAAGGGIAASGLRGGFGNSVRSDLLKDFARSRMGAQNQLTVANADLQDQRLKAYSDLAGNIDTSLWNRGSESFGTMADLRTFLDQLKYNRANEALSLFGQDVRNAEQDEFGRSLSAGQSYGTAIEANTINNRADVDNKMAAWRAELGRVSDDSLRRAMTNINTLASEISARTGLVLGVPQHLTAVRNARAANELAAQQIEAMKAMSAGAEGGGSETTTDTGINDPDLGGNDTPIKEETPVQPNNTARAPQFGGQNYSWD